MKINLNRRGALRYTVVMAEIGTPENPEIIEPGQGRFGEAAPPPPPGRFRMAWTLLRLLLTVTIPVLGFDLIYGWLLHTAANYGGVLPWLAVILLTPLALLFNLVGVGAHILLWPVILLSLAGRATVNPLHHPRFKVFNVR